MRLALMLYSAGVLAAAAGQVTPQQADELHQKLLAIAKHSSNETPSARRTVVTQDEMNAYLKYKVAGALPAGVADPSVTLVGNGRISGSAVVDLDAFRQSRNSSGGWLDPMSFLTGRLPVNATGTLVAKDGSGRFSLEAADVNGIPIPRTLLQQLVGFYTRSPERPNGINLDDPFDLPAKIRQIDIEPGRAVIVQ